MIHGCAMAINELNLNAGRLIVNRAELPDDVPAQTINRFCSPVSRPSPLLPMPSPPVSIKSVSAAALSA